MSTNNQTKQALNKYANKRLRNNINFDEFLNVLISYTYLLINIYDWHNYNYYSISIMYCFKFQKE